MGGDYEVCEKTEKRLEIIKKKRKSNRVYARNLKAIDYFAAKSMSLFFTVFLPA